VKREVEATCGTDEGRAWTSGPHVAQAGAPGPRVA
jgi:hypothetical protein